MHTHTKRRRGGREKEREGEGRRGGRERKKEREGSREGERERVTKVTPLPTIAMHLRQFGPI